MNPRVSGLSGFMNLLTQEEGLFTQDTLLARALSRKPCSLPLCRAKFARIICFYNHQPLDWHAFESFRIAHQITSTPYDCKSAPDLTDIRQLILLSHESKQQLHEDRLSILSKDIL